MAIAGTRRHLAVEMERQKSRQAVNRGAVHARLNLLSAAVAPAHAERRSDGSGGVNARAEIQYSGIGKGWGAFRGTGDCGDATERLHQFIAQQVGMLAMFGERGNVANDRVGEIRRRDRHDARQVAGDNDHVGSGKRVS